MLVQPIRLRKPRAARLNATKIAIIRIIPLRANARPIIAAIMPITRKNETMPNPLRSPRIGGFILRRSRESVEASEAIRVIWKVTKLGRTGNAQGEKKTSIERKTPKAKIADAEDFSSAMPIVLRDSISN